VNAPASARTALEEAVEAVSGAELARSFERLLDALPLAVSIESATLRLRDTGSDRLHLLAAVGIPFRDVRRLGLEQLTIAHARSVLAVGAEHTHARALGLVWLHGEWLVAEGEAIGLLLVGTRTARRPDAEELALLHRMSERLSLRLEAADRSPGALRSQALALVRRLVLETPSNGHGLLHELRPRERVVLELYTDGHTAEEIAELLVISPHTVRTHLKLAFRRLGVHSRAEAAEVVQRDQLMVLL